MVRCHETYVVVGGWLKICRVGLGAIEHSVTACVSNIILICGKFY